jgi:predicted nucleotidyltransferase
MKNRENTDGVAEKIKVLLEKVPGIQYAFIYGSYAKNPENQESDIDLMVVGGPDLAELDEIISRAIRNLKRAIYITSFTVREFRESVEVKEEFVLEALKGPKTMLIGHEKEMNEILDANCWQTNAA